MHREARIQETAKVQARIDALESACGLGKAAIYDMLEEYEVRLAYLEGSKEYMVHFEGGGWNTCYGQDMEYALDNAKSAYEYEGSNCKVRTVTLASNEATAAALRLFY